MRWSTVGVLRFFFSNQKVMHFFYNSFEHIKQGPFGRVVFEMCVRLNNTANIGGLGFSSIVNATVQKYGIIL